MIDHWMVLKYKLLGVTYTWLLRIVDLMIAVRKLAVISVHEHKVLLLPLLLIRYHVGLQALHSLFVKGVLSMGFFNRRLH
jgi:hypothetical protein